MKRSRINPISKKRRKKNTEMPKSTTLNSSERLKRLKGLNPRKMRLGVRYAYSKDGLSKPQKMCIMLPEGMAIFYASQNDLWPYHAYRTIESIGESSIAGFAITDRNGVDFVAT